MIRTFGAPARYVQGPGVLARLGELTARIARRPLVVADADVLAIVGEKIAVALKNREHLVLPFRGEVTRAAIAGLQTQAAAHKPDAVIGIGGGKGLDAAKGVARGLGLPFISVPSIASNDSPAGRAIAIYNEHHAIEAIESLAESPLLVLADTALIAGAPARFLRSGIGDAIAKKFEAERAVADGALNFFDGTATRTALAIADACYTTLREHGAAAMRASEAHESDEAFEAVVEACILMAGLAWESGGLSYAHAVVRGLLRARGASSMAHGEQVAYGALVQMAIEERSDAFLRDLMSFYVSVGLPRALAEMGLTNASEAEIEEIAHWTTMGPKGGRIIVAVPPAAIADAIRRVERLTR